MTAEQSGSPNAREVQYWNSAVTRVWSESHEPMDRMLAGLTQVALDLAAPQPGERVIDIGCGSGTTLLELAARVGPTGHVLGADIATQSVERARQRIAEAGFGQSEAVLADMSTHDFAPQSFDLAFSRLGVMFFADPSATFAKLHGAMNPGGRLTFVVFRKPQENPWSTAPAAALRDLLPPVAPPGPEEPGMFSWADPARVQRILGGAGFREVSLTPHDPAMRLSGSGGLADAIDFAMRFGPVARAASIGALNEPEAVRAGLQAFFQRHDGPQGVMLPGAIWIVQARV